MNLSRISHNRSRSRGLHGRKKTDASIISPIMEQEADSIMSKILDPIQFKKQKILQKELKAEKKQLQNKNFNLTDDVRKKENEYRIKDKLQINSNYALVGYLKELKKYENDVKLEAKRMNYLAKDKQWLIKFCDQLKEELAWAKAKVKTSEKIMHDLKATGQESVESLIRTVDGFEAKKLRLEKEIAQASRITEAKEYEHDLRTKKIEECKNFIKTQSGLQEQKMEDLSEKIIDKRQNILELKRQIVALEYKCEAQENSLVDIDKRIEDKVYNKILGNEQLQVWRQQKAEIMARTGENINPDAEVPEEDPNESIFKEERKKPKPSKSKSKKRKTKSKSKKAILA
ncbi:unnamed protein product [Moneuplotes crassus]|uniref:Uncharacterized protein n=1 Tax=Euplotes crassus TaxID=5936 RepID=A0AAD2CWT5_EUPCR|nr:unnamed protein product [Moneuplotes crassus]